MGAGLSERLGVVDCGASGAGAATSFGSGRGAERCTTGAAGESRALLACSSAWQWGQAEHMGWSGDTSALVSRCSVHLRESRKHLASTDVFVATAGQHGTGCAVSCLPGAIGAAATGGGAGGGVRGACWGEGARWSVASRLSAAVCPTGPSARAALVGGRRQAPHSPRVQGRAAAASQAEEWVAVWVTYAEAAGGTARCGT